MTEEPPKQLDKRHLLASKLKAPKLRYVLERPRLLRLVSPADKFKYVSLCAGPGYGKTTLMAQIAHFYPGSYVWYQVDSLDKDPAVFLRHIILGISDVCDAVGERSLARLSESSDAASEGVSVLSVLADELKENLGIPLAICFDDFHLLAGFEHASKFLTSLIYELPDECTVFISSRTKPRLKLGILPNNTLLELGTSDLQFSIDELKSLLSETWSIEINDDTLSQLHKNTEGWAAGLVLTEDHLRSGIDVPELFAGHKVKKNVYEYLAEEVLNRQSERLRDLLEKSSLINPVNPYICKEALGIQDAPALLAMAEKMNLFTTRVGETHLYRFHPLFRENLYATLKERIGSKKINTLRDSYGQAYEDAGEKNKAIDQYLKSMQFNKAANLIEEFGKELLDNGEHVTLIRWLRELPEPLSPTLQIFRGQMLLLSGQPHEALNLLQAVKQQLPKNNETLLYDATLIIAECYCTLDVPKKGVKEIRLLFQNERLSPSKKLDLLYRLSACCWAAYDDAGLKKCIYEARSLILEELSPHLLYKTDVMMAGLCLRRGEFRDAERLLTAIVNIKEVESTDRNRYMNNLASCLTMLGKYEDSKAMVEFCIETVKRQKESKRIMAIYDTYGCCLAALGQWDDANYYLTRSIALIHELDTTLTESGPPQYHLGSFARRRGEYNMAIDYHTKSLEISQAVNAYYDVAVSTINLGANYLRMENVEEAEKYFISGESIARKFQFKYLLTHIDFHRAWMHHVNGNEDLEYSFLSSALKRANRFQHNHFIIQEGKISLPLFINAINNDIEPDYVSWILEKIGTKSLSVIDYLIQSDRTDIRARCATLLYKISDPSAIALARKLSRDEDAEVKALAAIALERLREEISAPAEMLTPREGQVLELIAEGCSNGNIAKKLFLSERTVKTHVTNIFRKLGLTNRLEAALYFQKISKI